ncbi:MAG: DNA polymerase/3'-5' exonuclease PolX [Phycisphaerae bacterium]
MTNAQIARVFHEIADALEIQGAESFRVNAYRKIARAVDDYAGAVADLAARGEVNTLPGVGKASAEKIEELLTTGRVALREELRAVVPDSLLELLQIPSLGPKKAALLWKERGIESIAQLREAIDAGRLAGLKGLGDKSIAQLRHGIEFLATSAGRVRLGDVWPLALRVRDEVAAIAGVRRAELAGSLRRGVETVGDLDVLCVAADGARVVADFVALPRVKEVLVRGDTKGSVRVEVEDCGLIQVDLRVVPEESFGAAWQYFTGSKQHNVRLRELAQKRGWTLNEYSLSDGERVIASRDEADIYAAFGLPCFPPELREDRGEFELERVPADLLTLQHIRGDLHMHTTASDGHHTIEEMAAAARERGYEYICITDHSQSSVIANGLKPERLRAHIAAVRAIAKKTRDVTVWVGAEVDILAEGRLDYPDELLAELDFVVASVHTGMGQDIDANTRRTIAAIRNPYVNLIGHPTGRLLNRREAMPLDVDAVSKAAAAAGCALEINASSYRLDLKDQHARLARDNGATICIDCDAHATDQLDQMSLGVITARRAGLCRRDVLNTRTADQVRAFVQARRRT